MRKLSLIPLLVLLITLFTLPIASAHPTLTLITDNMQYKVEPDLYGIHIDRNTQTAYKLALDAKTLKPVEAPYTELDIPKLSNNYIGEFANYKFYMDLPNFLPALEKPVIEYHPENKDTLACYNINLLANDPIYLFNITIGPKSITKSDYDDISTFITNEGKDNTLPKDKERKLAHYFLTLLNNQSDLYLNQLSDPQKAKLLFQVSFYTETNPLVISRVSFDPKYYNDVQSLILYYIQGQDIIIVTIEFPSNTSPDNIKKLYEALLSFKAVPVTK